MNTTYLVFPSDKLHRFTEDLFKYIVYGDAEYYFHLETLEEIFRILTNDNVRNNEITRDQTIKQVFGRYDPAYSKKHRALMKEIKTRKGSR